MTTIVYRDGIIAYDSQINEGAAIIYDDWDKKIVRNGVIFVLCGRMDQYEKMVDLYFSWDAPPPDLDAGAILSDGGKLYSFSHDESHLFKSPIPADKYYATGSGMDYALGALDMGATAAEAVKVAIKRDQRSGGRVRTVRVL